MGEHFRVVECLSTPSDLFCIYDYTKIAYLTDNYICIRELISNDAGPTFIRLGSPHDPEVKRYFGLASYPNLLILAEKGSTRDCYLHFYSHQ
jgi:hypothetical protein